MVKFLIVRFSSIGDIVLTTPVVRCLKQQVPNAEVHYLTKPQYVSVLDNNPYLDKIHVLQENINDTVVDIQNENFDYLVDLHHNLRTSILKRKLPIVSFAFDKLNWKKWLLVNLKINKMPDCHIVDRYMDTLNVFDVTNDNKGLDYFIPLKDEIVPEQMHSAFRGKYICLIIGATYETKQIPQNKLINIANGVGVPVCLIGGKDVQDKATEIEKYLKIPFLNTVGKINLHQSASFIRQSALVITPDTGMMHIASAFKKDIISLWGNTVADFGMYPYLSGDKSKVFDVELSCRPCSKIGFKKCPKKHFNCMNNIDEKSVIEHIKLVLGF